MILLKYQKVILMQSKQSMRLCFSMKLIEQHKTWIFRAVCYEIRHL
jgi:hypothetical protein